MNIKLEKSNLKYINACADALKNSSLGQYYFSNDNSALEAVKEGFEQKTLYIALKDDDFIGFLYYIPFGAFHGYPYIHLFVIKEDFRKKGIGKIVLEKFEEMIFKHVDKIFLVVADFNIQAKRFYENNGYTQVETIPGLYREGITEYLMMIANQ